MPPIVHSARIMRSNGNQQKHQGSIKFRFFTDKRVENCHSIKMEQNVGGEFPTESNNFDLPSFRWELASDI